MIFLTGARQNIHRAGLAFFMFLLQILFSFLFLLEKRAARVLK